MTNSILVFIEQHDKKIADVSLELLGKARDLNTQLKAEVAAVVLGSSLPQLEKLGNYGCDTVYYVDDKRLSHFTSVPYAKTIINIIKKYQPQIVLFGATIIGRDVAPRVASSLKCGLTADCTDLQIEDNNLLQIRPAFGGSIVATIISPDHTPSMATVREGVMKMPKPNLNKKANVISEKNVLQKNDFLTEVIKVIKEVKQVNLKGAKIIVAAGMGAANEKSMQLIQELAKILGAEIGCSRPVVDANLLPPERQIGQTGTTVRPNLYIACGISGQIQHTSGMNEAKRIIAINKDEAAPIFNLAHYKIVGDLNDVLAKMIAAYKNKSSE